MLRFGNGKFLSRLFFTVICLFAFLLAGKVASAADPTPIGTRDQLAGLTPTGSYSQIANINLDSTWVPIGPFAGSFDGGNFSIAGLTSSLFESLVNGATISNVTINANIAVPAPEPSSSSAPVSVGAVASTASGVVSVTNVSLTGSVDNQSGGATGGLIGSTAGTVILTNTSSTAAISGTTQTGGLIGSATTPPSSPTFDPLGLAPSPAPTETITLKGTTTITGSVTSTGDNSSTGGVVGQANSVLVAPDSNGISILTVSAPVTSTGEIALTGGVVGSASTVTIASSSVTASAPVTSTGDNSATGGVVGAADVTIASSSVTVSAPVNSTGANSATGGVVGSATAVTANVSTLIVSAPVTSTGANSATGGVIGASATVTIDSSKITVSAPVAGTSSNSSVEPTNVLAVGGVVGSAGVLSIQSTPPMVGAIVPSQIKVIAPVSSVSDVESAAAGGVAGIVTTTLVVKDAVVTILAPIAAGSTNAFASAGGVVGSPISALSEAREAILLARIERAQLAILGKISASAQFDAAAGGVMGSTGNLEISDSQISVVATISSSSESDLYTDYSYTDEGEFVNNGTYPVATVAGGVLGGAKGNVIIDASQISVIADITVDSPSTSYAGGIIGGAEGTVTIRDSSSIYNSALDVVAHIRGGQGELTAVGGVVGSASSLDISDTVLEVAVLLEGSAAIDGSTLTGFLIGTAQRFGHPELFGTADFLFFGTDILFDSRPIIGTFSTSSTPYYTLYELNFSTFDDLANRGPPGSDREVIIQSESVSGVFDSGYLLGKLGDFSGIFLGSGYSISGLVDPLFSNLGSGATILGVKLDGVDIVSAPFYATGALAAYSDSATIIDTHVSGSISGSNSTGGLIGSVSAYGSEFTVVSSSVAGSISGNNSTGGLIGSVSAYGGDLTISASNFTGSVSGSDYATGGLVGTGFTGSADLIISASTVIGSVSGGPSDTGGLIGIGSTDLGDITISASSFAGSISGGDSTGGLMGYGDSNLGDFTIASSSVIGTVTGAQYTGGLIGYNHSFSPSDFNITSSSVTGTVTGANKTGGLIGFAQRSSSGDLNIVSSSFTGNVSGADLTGGLIGESNSISSGDLTIISSSVSGTVTGANYTGGLIGYSDSNYISGNLNIVSSTVIATINGGQFVGGFVGRSIDNAVGNVNISGSTFTGSIKGGYRTGGLIGASYSSGRGVSIDSSSVTGTVSGAGEVGGLIGSSTVNGSPESTSITNSYVAGEINSTCIDSCSIGGFIGSSTGALIIDFSYRVGNIEGCDVEGCDPGGIVGRNSSGSVITISYTSIFPYATVNSTKTAQDIDLVGNNASINSTGSYTAQPVGVYQVANLQDLADLSSYLAMMYAEHPDKKIAIIQTASINVDINFESIDWPFDYFIGNGFSISGLNNPLFNELDDQSVLIGVNLTGVTVVGSTVEDEEEIPAIGAIAKGSNGSVLLIDVHATGTVQFDGFSDNFYGFGGSSVTGGLIGFVEEDLRAISSSFTGSIRGSDTFVGGLVGAAGRATQIINSTFSGVLTADSVATPTVVGGLLGLHCLTAFTCPELAVISSTVEAIINGAAWISGGMVGFSAAERSNFIDADFVGVIKSEVEFFFGPQNGFFIPIPPISAGLIAYSFGAVNVTNSSVVGVVSGPLSAGFAGAVGCLDFFDQCILGQSQRPVDLVIANSYLLGAVQGTLQYPGPNVADFGLFISGDALISRSKSYQPTYCLGDGLYAFCPERDFEGDQSLNHLIGDGFFDEFEREFVPGADLAPLPEVDLYELVYGNNSDGADSPFFYIVPGDKPIVVIQDNYFLDPSLNVTKWISTPIDYFFSLAPVTISNIKANRDGPLVNTFISVAPIRIANSQITFSNTKNDITGGLFDRFIGSNAGKYHKSIDEDNTVIAVAFIPDEDPELTLDSVKFRGNILVTNLGDENIYAGAIAGNLIGDILLSGVSVVADIRGSTTGSGDVFVGGLIGYQQGDLESRDTTFTGFVGAISSSSGDAYAGGFAGEINGKLTDSCVFTCTNIAAVVEATSAVGSLVYAGGLAGLVHQSVVVLGVQFEGSVKAVTEAGKAYAGGLIGRILDTDSEVDTESSITEVRVIGVVNSSGVGGGFVGSVAERLIAIDESAFLGLVRAGVIAGGFIGEVEELLTVPGDLLQPRVLILESTFIGEVDSLASTSWKGYFVGYVADDGLYSYGLELDDSAAFNFRISDSTDYVRVEQSSLIGNLPIDIYDASGSYSIELERPRDVLNAYDVYGVGESSSLVEPTINHEIVVIQLSDIDFSQFSNLISPFAQVKYFINSSFTISNVDAPLFESLVYGATIIGVRLDGVEIVSESQMENTGAIARNSNAVTFIDTHVSGTVSGLKATGGLLGSVNINYAGDLTIVSSTVTGAVSNGEISVSPDDHFGGSYINTATGGLLGSVNINYAGGDLTIVSSTVTGTVSGGGNTATSTPAGYMGAIVNSTTGGLIGKSDFYSSGDLTIVSSTVTGTVNGGSNSADSFDAFGGAYLESITGGLLGSVNINYAGDLTIVSSTVTGTVIGGGNTVAVTSSGFGSANIDSYTGGLIGKNYIFNAGDIFINLSSVTGIVSGAGDSGTSIGGGYVDLSTKTGGFIGDNVNNASGGLTFESSTFTGSITGGNKTGGLIGDLYFVNSDDLIVSSTTVIGTVSGLGMTGGLIGNEYLNGSGDLLIKSTSFIGSVNGGDENYTGGIIGRSYNLLSGNSTIDSSFVIGSITGVENTGGLIGQSFRVESGYLDIFASAVSGSVIGAQLTGTLIGSSYSDTLHDFNISYSSFFDFVNSSQQTITPLVGFGSHSQDGDYTETRITALQVSNSQQLEALNEYLDMMYDYVPDQRVVIIQTASFNVDADAESIDQPFDYFISNGFTITGLTKPLFDSIGPNSVIVGLRLDSVNIASSAPSTGAIANSAVREDGELISSATPKTVIVDTHVRGIVSNSNEYGSGVGGFIGNIGGDSQIIGSTFIGAVEGLQRVGGFVGTADSISIVSSSVKGEVGTNRTDLTRIYPTNNFGGVVGFADTGVVVSTTFLGSIKGENYVAGLIGFTNDTLISINSIVTGSVIALSGSSTVAELTNTFGILIQAETSFYGLINGSRTSPCGEPNGTTCVLPAGITFTNVAYLSDLLIPSDGIVLQTQDIYADFSLTRISDFSGTYIGGGYSIYGLTSSLFNQLSDGAMIIGLDLVGVNIENSACNTGMGAIANCSDGSVSIFDSSVTGLVDANDGTGADISSYSVGGFIGVAAGSGTVDIAGSRFIGTARNAFTCSNSNGLCDSAGPDLVDSACDPYLGSCNAAGGLIGASTSFVDVNVNNDLFIGIVSTLGGVAGGLIGQSGGQLTIVDTTIAAAVTSGEYTGAFAGSIADVTVISDSEFIGILVGDSGLGSSYTALFNDMTPMIVIESTLYNFKNYDDIGSSFGSEEYSTNFDVYGLARYGEGQGPLPEIDLTDSTRPVIVIQFEDVTGFINGITNGMVDYFVSGACNENGACELSGIESPLSAAFGQDSIAVGNLQIRDSAIVGNINVDGVAGALFPVFYGVLVIEDSSFTGSVTGTEATGGFIGEMYGDISILNSHVNGSISGGPNTGGLIGRNTSYSAGDLEIDLSSFTGSVNGDVLTGGLIGQVFKVTSGDVIITSSSATGSISGSNVTGGLIGQTEILSSGNVEIYDSYVVGNISGGSFTGGLIGDAFIGSSGDLIIERTSVTGSVSGGDLTGGLIGYVIRLDSRIFELSSTTVSGSVSGETNTGGLIGNNITYSSDDLTISSSSFSGSVLGGANTGGLIGNSTRNSRGDLIIETTSFTGTVSGRESVGGLIGIALSNVEIEDVVIVASVISDLNVGGVIGGQSQGTISVKGVDFEGTILSTANTGLSYSGPRAGGVVGYLFNEVSGNEIWDFNFKGTLTGGNYTGGLVGSLLDGHLDIQGSNFIGKIATTGFYVGGLVGLTEFANLTIEDSTFIGEIRSVHEISEYDGEIVRIGGLIGQLNHGTDTTINSSSFTGVVSGIGYIGGLIGSIGNQSESENLGDSHNLVSISNSYVAGLVIARAGSEDADILAIGALIGSIVPQDDEENIEIAASCFTGILFDRPETICSDAEAGYIFIGDGSGQYVLRDGIDPTLPTLPTIYFNQDDVSEYLDPQIHTIIIQTSDWLETSASVALGGFTGTFIGNGYSISGLANPLFSSLNDGATIIGLNLIDVAIVSGSTVGTGAIARTSGSATIIDTHVSGSILGGDNTGGLIGRSNNYSGDMTIVSSSLTGDVVGSNKTGGLIGMVDTLAAGNVTITTSSVTGNIDGRNFTGGLIGKVETSITDFLAIVSSSMTGSVSGTEDVGGLIGNYFSDTAGDIKIISTAVTGIVDGGINVGGLIGQMYMQSSGASSITSTTVTGIVDGGTASTGGVIGYIFNDSLGEIAFTSVSVSGSVSGNTYTGGLIGYIQSQYFVGIPENPYNEPLLNGGTAGDLNITSSSVTGGVSGGIGTGGFIGFTYRFGSGNLTITSSSLIGNVSGGDNTGGLIGKSYDYMSGNLNIDSTYLTGSVSGGEYTGGFIGNVATLNSGVLTITDSSIFGFASPNEQTLLIDLIGNDDSIISTGSYTGSTATAYQVATLEDLTALSTFLANANSLPNMKIVIIQTASIEAAQNLSSITGNFNYFISNGYSITGLTNPLFDLIASGTVIIGMRLLEMDMFNARGGVANNAGQNVQVINSEFTGTVGNFFNPPAGVVFGFMGSGLILNSSFLGYEYGTEYISGAVWQSGLVRQVNWDFEIERRYPTGLSFSEPVKTDDGYSVTFLGFDTSRFATVLPQINNGTLTVYFLTPWELLITGLQPGQESTITISIPSANGFELFTLTSSARVGAPDPGTDPGTDPESPTQITPREREAASNNESSLAADNLRALNKALAAAKAEYKLLQKKLYTEYLESRKALWGYLSKPVVGKKTPLNLRIIRRDQLLTKVKLDYSQGSILLEKNYLLKVEGLNNQYKETLKKP